jgi:23S rRNA pseudouridine2605 synthase
MSERLHKLLAQSGLGSRREVERWMLEGRVLLNGVPAKPGDRFNTGDRVVLDGRDVGQRLHATPLGKVLAYHKPQGQSVQLEAAVKELKPSGPNEESVLERLPAIRGSRWLVINTMQTGDSGLLLVTTDGRLADALRRRSERVSATYMTRVLVPTPEDFDLAQLGLRVRYDEEEVEFSSIEPAGGEGTNRWFKVSATHSHRRAAVRALFESHGLTVSRVIQLSFGPIELQRNLPRGKHRPLDAAQVEQLYQLAELPVPQREPAPDPRKKKAVRRGGPGRRPTGSRRTGR